MSPAAGLTTFLMTDVEGSTRLWEEQREAMATSLADHDAMLRSIVTSGGGRVVKSTGDGILAAYDNASQALRSALTIQQRFGRQKWATSQPLKVRVAVHTGDAQAREGDYFGPALNRTARLLAVGHGGQILVSAAAAELGRAELPAGVSLTDLGEHRLRDLYRPERVFQLDAPDLEKTFPALRSERSLRTNLPAALTSFVGRQRELRELRELALQHRLVTLVGVGGTGKTRLMIELASGLIDSHRDGVWLVELATVSDPRLVLGQVGRAVGLSDEPGRTTIDALTEFLRDKRLLLLLDNCEHLIGAVAETVEAMLAACPNLAVFASSREALGVRGEVAYPVPSLALPVVEESASGLEPSEAVRLFVDRATEALPSFELDSANAATVADICRRLDGIPLAIELAAARVNVLSVDEIDARLGDRFRLLTGGRRSVLPRQQTLQALIDWSWNLLTPDDRQLLRRLSVFSGGWSLDAAADVTGGLTDGSDQLATLDGLTRLVDRSLVQVEHDETTRYRLLETIRQYARDRLVEAGEADDIRASHFDYFHRLALAAEVPLSGPEMIVWLRRLDADIDNLRAALDWGNEANVDQALRMVLALAGYFRVRAFGGEPVERLSRAAEVVLARDNPTSGPERERSIVGARVLAAAAQANGAWGNPSRAIAYGNEALALARLLNDRDAILEALGAWAVAAVFSGMPAKAFSVTTEALELANERNDPWTTGMVRLGRALTFFGAGDMTAALHEVELANEQADRSGNPFVIAFAALTRGRTAGFLREPERARDAFRQAADIYRELGDRRFELVARSDLGHALRRSGELTEAESIYRDVIGDWYRLGNRSAVANQLESFAFIALARTEARRAARLLGAAQQVRSSTGAQMLPFEVIEYDESMASLRAALDESALAEEWAAGAQLTLEQAIALAVSEAG